MTIAERLDEYNDLLLKAYEAVGEKGATIPEQKNLTNLIASIQEIRAREFNAIYDLCYMQDFALLTKAQYDTIKSSMVAERIYTLADTRDKTVYPVALLKDENIWMVENLRLGGAEPMTLTPEETDIAEGSFTLPASSTDGFVDGTDKADIYIDETYGGYYSYLAATAGSGEGLTSGEAQNSIAPKGWRLPTLADSQALATAYENDTNALQKTPAPGFVLSGYSNEQGLQTVGQRGYFRTATTLNTTNAYQFRVNDTNIIADDNQAKRYGFSVRCLVREPSV